MEDFIYKEYSEEEDKIYSEAMNGIMEGLKNGLTFQESCSAVIVEDEQLKKFIVDDALKIIIAETHYEKGHPLKHVADALCVPIEVVEKANAEMIEDVEITASEACKMNNPYGQTGTA